MFIYLVAPVATLVIIFGLLHIKCLGDWLRSAVHCSRTLYNGLICRPMIQASLNTEDLRDGPTATATARDRLEYEDVPLQKITFSNKDGLSDVLLADAGNKSKHLNALRYSFEDILSEEKDEDLGLPALKTLQLGTTQDDTIRTTKQEGKENLFESLKSSIEKSTYPSSRLSTKQIYNMLLNETLKDSEAKQKLLDIDKKKFSEMPQREIKDQFPSSSENNIEEDNITK